MNTVTAQADGQVAKLVLSEAPRDLYDPHFPARQRTTDVSNRKRTETFDPHFPQRARAVGKIVG